MTSDWHSSRIGFTQDATAALARKSPKAIAVALRQSKEIRTIYESSGKLGLPVMVYACAFVNLVFWGNLSQWVYSDYKVLNSETGKFEDATNRTRIGYAASLATLGVGISTAFALISRRYAIQDTSLIASIIKRIDVLPGGLVRLYTGFFNSSRASGAHSLPIHNMSLRKSLFTGVGPNNAISENGSYTQLLCKDYLVGFLLDRRGTFLASPKVLDELFHVVRR